MIDVGMRLGDAIDPCHLANGFECSRTRTHSRTLYDTELFAFGQESQKIRVRFSSQKKNCFSKAKKLFCLFGRNTLFLKVIC
jgi:hypothetical protein